MSEALAEVKRTFGAGAVIIHTRTIRAPGLKGFLGRQIVEVAAATDVPRRNERRTTDVVPQEPAGNTVAVQRQKGTMAPERRMPRHIADAYLRNRRTETPAPNDQLKALRDEISGIRSSLDDLVRSNCPPSVAGLPEPLTEGYMTLVRHGVAEPLAAEVVRSLAEEMTEAELWFADKIQRRTTERLAEHMRVAGPIQLTAGERRVVALIGPTGVGKTTTIAKLAANFKVRGHRRVALITIDTYRIAAVQQLQTIADIIKVPLCTVETIGDLQQALGELRDYDLVLVDTAGRSQRDELKMNDLKSFIKASGADEVHLVVSATGSLGNIQEVIKRFREIGPNRLIITKVDEAEALGTVVSASSQTEVPVSYVTVGQEIPNDIEVADGTRLAEMVWER